MALTRKIRKDSIIGNLAPDMRVTVDEMLSGGQCGLQDVVDYLAEHGERISLQSVSEYYRNHLKPQLIARSCRIAEGINEQSVDGLAEASIKMAQQQVFDLLAMPVPDAKTIKALMEIIFKAQSLDQSDRKLKLLEAKAAEADKAKEVTQNKQLTDEEKMNRYKEIFGIKV